MRLSLVLVACLLLVGPRSGWAAGLDEAKALKDEAFGILKKGSGLTIKPEEYARCVVKLEKAMDIVEKANAFDTPLAQEVSSALYWARKFATVQTIAHINKEKKRSVKSKPKDQGGLPGLGEKASEAKKLFATGKMYAQSHTGDDYAVGLRWFQIADQTAGTDYSVRALGLARAAQKRHVAQQSQGAKTEEASLKDTPGGNAPARRCRPACTPDARGGRWGRAGRRRRRP